MSNGVSLSGIRQSLAKKTIAEELAGQTEDLKGTPWWKTVGAIALPLILTAAMGPAGAALASYGGIGSSLTGMLGAGLTSAGAASGGSTIGNILRTAAQVGTKAGYNWLGQKATGAVLDTADTRSEKDIKVSGGPLAKFYGKSAQDRLRKEYKIAKDAEGETKLAGATLAAITQQFGPDVYSGIKDMFGGDTDTIAKVLEGTPDLVKGGEATFGDVNVLDKVAEIHQANPPIPVGQPPVSPPPVSQNINPSTPGLRQNVSTGINDLFSHGSQGAGAGGLGRITQPGAHKSSGQFDFGLFSGQPQPTTNVPIGVSGPDWGTTAVPGSYPSVLTGQPSYVGAPSSSQILQGVDDQTILDIILSLQNK